MHPDLVALVREWIVGIEQDESLFPRLARKKTYTTVQKDLGRAGIPYETHEGVADFHAAGRHSRITGPIASGASIMEAKELARHADIRQTAKYTHIGMPARASALGGLHYPKTCVPVEFSGMCRDSGVWRQTVSADVRNGDREGKTKKRRNPFLGGGCVASCHRLSGVVS